MGGGSSPKPSKPKDMTPKEFKELRGPLQDMLSDWLGFEQTTETVYDRKPIFGGVGGMPGMGTGRWEDGQGQSQFMGWQQVPRQVTSTQYSGQPNMPQYQGPTTAQMSPLEQFFLGQVAQHQNPAQQQSHNFLQQMIGSPFQSTALSTLQQLQAPQGNINPFASTPGGNQTLQGILSGMGLPQTNPFGQSQGGQDFLAQLMSGQNAVNTNPFQFNQGAQQMLQQTSQGQGLPQTDFTAGGGAMQQGQQAMQNVAGNDQSFINPAVGRSLEQTLGGDFLHADSNPYLQSAMEAATRPLQQAYQESTIPQLKAQFNAAGQMIQPGGSSPFDMAAARSMSGLMDAMGDVNTRMAFANYDSERARQMQAAGLGIQQGATDLAQQGQQLQAGQALGQLGLGAAGLQQQGDQANLLAQLQAAGMSMDAAQIAQQGGFQNLQSQLQGLNAGLSAAELQQRGDLAGLQAQLDAMGIGLSAEQLVQQTRAADQDRAGQAARDQSQAELAGREQQLSALEQSLNLGQGELQNMMTQLQASALPRLIEQHGLDAGMQMFNQNMDRLMAIMQLATGASSPTVAYVGGTPGQASPIPQAIGAAGGLAGGMLGTGGIGGLK